MQIKPGLERRLVSRASSIVEDCGQDETFGLLAQSAAKAALVFASSASQLVDALLVASKGYSSTPMDGAKRRNIEYVYSALATRIQEEVEFSLAPAVSLIASLGQRLSTDEEHSDSLAKWMEALELSAEDDPEEDDDNE